MYFEEYGVENKEIIVFVHGANMVHCFANQYCLKKNYHIVIPHLIGFGNEVNRDYTKDANIKELLELITSFKKKVNLVCYSLGSQLGFALINERPDLFKKVILVSPWLHKEETDLKGALDENMAIVDQLKSSFFARIATFTYHLNGKQRREFVKYIKSVSRKTIKNMVYDMIDFKDYPLFKDIKVDMLALVGEKEDQLMKDTVDQLSEMNHYCQSEMWEGDFHNIPYRDSKRFTQTIKDFLQEKGDYVKCN